MKGIADNKIGVRERKGESYRKNNVRGRCKRGTPRECLSTVSELAGLEDATTCTCIYTVSAVIVDLRGKLMLKDGGTSCLHSIYKDV